MTDQATATTTAAGERSGRREQNKAENRAALLKAARTVFADMGYGAAGVRDIVWRTDLASGTFYNYFKDKSEIFEAVVREMSVELMRRHRNGRAQSLPLLELLERRRWDDAPRAARWIRQRCGVASPSVARLLAELANLGDDR